MNDRAIPAESDASRRRTAGWLVLGAGLVGIVFTLDVLTGSDLAFSLFYLIPIALLAWRLGRAAGLAASAASAIAWFVATQWTGLDAAHPVITAWNAGMQAAFFVIVAWTLAALRGGLTRERELSERLASSYRALDHEMARVGALQRELLPGHPPALDGFDLAVHYAPSARAGGDYYDFFPLPGDRLGILLADVSGHGAPAAVVMAILRTLLRVRATPLDDPAALLAYANAALLGNVPERQFVTASYAVLDQATGVLTWSLAGHMPPIRVHGEGCPGVPVEDLAASGGPPLGLFPDARYDTARADLHAEEAIVFYTDGLSEAMDEHGALLGETRVHEVLARARGQAAPALCSSLLRAVDRHRGRAPLADDLTLVVLHVDQEPAQAANPPLGSSFAAH